VERRWSDVRVVHVEAGGVGDAPQVGARLEVRALVDLDELTPADVTVQAAYGRVDESDQLRVPTYVTLTPGERGDDGLYRYSGEVPLERAGSFGYTVRVLPHCDRLPSDADLGLMTTA
jgi:starch phosphorylase